MKKDLHPKKYRFVVFKDVSCDYSFLTRSTIHTKETIKWEDGKEYPLYKMDISNKSHPYFTGQQNLIDTAGRIEKFNQKYNLKESAVEESFPNDAVSEEADSAKDTPSNDAVSEEPSPEDKNAQDS
jgi:large subunit ribosomal protein L31